MNRIAVFPYDENFYPLLKNSESMVGFEISKVFSIRGWGYVGRNIFDVSDTTSRNIHVEDISEKLNEEEFDIFLLAEPEHNIDENYIVQIIDRMAQMNKTIWIFKSLSDEIITKIDTICEKNKVEVQFFSKDIENVVFDGEEILYDISTPIITVAGMGEKTNKMELQMDLVISLQKDKYKVVWVSSRNEALLYNGQKFPTFMDDEGVSEKKKILMYNHYLKWIEQSEKPDVILIGIPGGIMPDSKKQEILMNKSNSSEEKELPLYKETEVRVPIHLKITLTIREAAEYSNIGINKIDSMLKQPNCPFVLYVGTRKLVKRKEFEEYIRRELII